MARVRITKSRAVPKAANGIQLTAGTNGTNGNHQFNSNNIPGTLRFSESPTRVNDTLQPVARNGANLEAERGETAVVSIGGLPAQFKIGGKRHTQGGTPLNLPDDSFIFSDTAKMKITDPNILAQFAMVPKKSGYTPAEIAKKYDLNKFRKILADPNTEDLERKTAEASISNCNIKLGKLALVQESMKGFPQGIPAIAMPYILANNIDPKSYLPNEGQEEQPDADMGVSRYGGNMVSQFNTKDSIPLLKAQRGYSGPINDEENELKQDNDNWERGKKDGSAIDAINYIYHPNKLQGFENVNTNKLNNSNRSNALINNGDFQTISKPFSKDVFYKGKNDWENLKNNDDDIIKAFYNRYKYLLSQNKKPKDEEFIKLGNEMLNYNVENSLGFIPGTDQDMVEDLGTMLIDKYSSSKVQKIDPYKNLQEKVDNDDKTIDNVITLRNNTLEKLKTGKNEIKDLKDLKYYNGLLQLNSNYNKLILPSEPKKTSYNGFNMFQMPSEELTLEDVKDHLNKNISNDPPLTKRIAKHWYYAGDDYENKDKYTKKYNNFISDSEDPNFFLTSNYNQLKEGRDKDKKKFSFVEYTDKEGNVKKSAYIPENIKKVMTVNDFPKNNFNLFNKEDYFTINNEYKDYLKNKKIKEKALEKEKMDADAALEQEKVVAAQTQEPIVNKPRVNIGPAKSRPQAIPTSTATYTYQAPKRYGGSSLYEAQTGVATPAPKKFKEYQYDPVNNKVFPVYDDGSMGEADQLTTELDEKDYDELNTLKIAAEAANKLHPGFYNKASEDFQKRYHELLPANARDINMHKGKVLREQTKHGLDNSIPTWDLRNNVDGYYGDRTIRYMDDLSKIKKKIPVKVEEQKKTEEETIKKPFERNTPQAFQYNNINPPYWKQNTIEVAGAIGDRARIAKRNPYVAKPNYSLMRGVEYNPDRELAANAEQANIANQGSMYFTDPRQMAAQQSATQGLAGKNAADIMGRYNNLNVGVANQTNAQNAGIKNQAAITNATLDTNLYDKYTAANDNFDIARKQATQNIRKSYINAITQRANTANLNSLNPNFSVNPDNGGIYNFRPTGPFDPTATANNGFKEAIDAANKLAPNDPTIRAKIFEQMMLNGRSNRNGYQSQNSDDIDG